MWTDEPDEDDSGFAQHLRRARSLGDELAGEPLGRPPDDLVSTLVEVGLGSPALAAVPVVRPPRRRPVAGSRRWWVARAGSAWGFRSLFSGPEATAVVRATTGHHEAYWRGVLAYAVGGHLQAVVDEYVHVLKDWRGYLRDEGTGVVDDLADVAYAALEPADRELRHRHPRHVEREPRGGVPQDAGRFAIRFGDQAIEGEQQQHRAQQASQAFNSPFWPFVLSTTSVGQEGLDFHLYAHAVVHWNLPSNPVDLEQREGRVHRYKGHAIRENVAGGVRGRRFRRGRRRPVGPAVRGGRGDVRRRGERHLAVLGLPPRRRAGAHRALRPRAPAEPRRRQARAPAEGRGDLPALVRPTPPGGARPLPRRPHPRGPVGGHRRPPVGGPVSALPEDHRGSDADRASDLTLTNARSIMGSAQPM
ncbi:MAG: helicase-related protein [Acidimicrobiia bacterium]|nr:helicase-related protein [Acidimicrobiia bacterium]